MKTAQAIRKWPKKVFGCLGLGGEHQHSVTTVNYRESSLSRSDLTGIKRHSQSARQ